jgi:CubicO group peptidase (beta-lactamase class C family)
MLKDLLANDDAYSAGVALITHRGEPVDFGMVGQTSFFPESVPITGTTLFDLASLTKVFVAVTALSLGPSIVDEPVRGDIRVSHLLTHTSGLPAVLPLPDLPDVAARRAAVANAPLSAQPGEHFEYSCTGFMALGFFLEERLGKPLPELVRERVIEPLGLADTGYHPDPARVFAATEVQPGRGLVSGIVHDESSWSLGGGAGNAGIFGTAQDVARLGQWLLGQEFMTRDHLPAGLDPGFGHGYGVRVGDPAFMGPLSSPECFGHTGFTGTSLVVDRRRELVVVLLTNRVHPSRDRSGVAALRLAVATHALQLTH